MIVYQKLITVFVNYYVKEKHDVKLGLIKFWSKQKREQKALFKKITNRYN